MGSMCWLFWGHHLGMNSRWIVHKQGSTTTTAGSLPMIHCCKFLTGWLRFDHSPLTSSLLVGVLLWNLLLRGAHSHCSKTSMMSFFTTLQQAWQNALVKPSRSKCHWWTPHVSNGVCFYSCFSHFANILFKFPLFAVLINVFIHYPPYCMMKNFCPCYFIILSLY